MASNNNERAAPEVECSRLSRAIGSASVFAVCVAIAALGNTPEQTTQQQPGALAAPAPSAMVMPLARAVLHDSTAPYLRQSLPAQVLQAATDPLELPSAR